MTLSKLIPIQNSIELFYWIEPELQLLEEQKADDCFIKVIPTNVLHLNLKNL